MENEIQYGPYSPQETDRAVRWLQDQKIHFEIIRNDQEAKEGLMNDGQNVVNLADLRTGIYLAQIFYVSLKGPSDEQKKKFENIFCLKDEVAHRLPDLVADDEAQLQKDRKKNQDRKRRWAWWAFGAMMLPILWWVANIIFGFQF